MWMSVALLFEAKQRFIENVMPSKEWRMKEKSLCQTKYGKNSAYFIRFWSIFARNGCFNFFTFGKVFSSFFRENERHFHIERHSQHFAFWAFNESEKIFTRICAIVINMCKFRSEKWPIEKLLLHLKICTWKKRRISFSQCTYTQ